MNKVRLTFLFACLVFTNGFAQPKPPKIYGTVYIDNTTLMAETEVTIREWMGFIVNNNFDVSLFPDTACLTKSVRILFSDLHKRKDLDYLKVFNNQNDRRIFGAQAVRPANQFDKLVKQDSSYLSIDVPITGITYTQAQKFCKWKEGMIYNAKNVKVTVSLPSVEIYKRVITNIDTLSKNGHCFTLNCSTAKCQTIAKDKASKTQGGGLVIVRSYFPTSLGLYNIEGNAAEMTSTYGIAMGGSFRQTARESYNDRNQRYNKAEDWLGFRYIISSK
ncbi:SUMF1/EgtB/PvdO family nonheme iron enzyme [Mucilaginibacter sp.]|uniref:SUMF1/EgtB/PvdO family nonheme iron enzyme n=1 Tax=Mucilaginibacter sp. TaxID=1882438 RepID=UPI00284148DC|nr:SUMF1/EgtB/PvdO family nonheme iron enzyme [Mucilaginibacter sp.]MDR3695368.1 SUMF1/EgtB/PvdO family nonheme iron enzyme [Mucilaginibacter sp.]